MKILKYIIVILLPALLTMSYVGCTDDLNEVKEISYSRVFSPNNVEATVLNRTNVRLNWSKSSAESYTVELFDNDSLTFEGAPVKTISEILPSQLPYVIENLDGETRYSARVKGIKSGVEDSKWSGVTFQTAAEHLALPFEDEDISPTSVVFRWPAGQQLTKIVLQPGDIVHTVSSDEVAEGIAVIEGLTGETEYTAKMMNGNKVRATVLFTTLLDIGNAIAIYPEDDFVEILAGASDGDVFALFPGTYGAGSKFTVSKNVEVKAVYPYDKPILDGYISMEDNSSLTLNAIVLDGGSLADGNQAIIFATNGAVYGDIVLESCEVRNHVKGLYYLNVTSLVESINISNSILHDIECSGGDFMDSRKGSIKTILLSNNTIYNCALARDMIRFDNASADFPGIEPQIIVDHNTIYNVCNGTSRRLLYVRYTGHTIRFTNNLVASTAGVFSNQSSTNVPYFENNNYFEAPGFLPGGSTISLFFDSTGFQFNPQFEDASNGNFKVGDDDIKAKEIGASRWR